MSQKVQAQAAKFWQALAGGEALTAYRQALDVTWNILKEGAILIWLVLCLVLVFFDWGSEKAIAAGRGTRDWLGSMQKNDSKQLTSDAGKKLLEASKASVAMTITQARQQLGLPEKEKPPAVLQAAPTPPKADTKPAAAPPPATPETAPGTPAPPAPSSPESAEL